MRLHSSDQRGESLEQDDSPAGPRADTVCRQVFTGALGFNEKRTVMASDRARLCLGRAIGVYVSRDRITLTEVGTTVRGTAVLSQFSEAIDSEGPAAALKRLFAGHPAPRRLHGVPAYLGLGPERTFFMSCMSSFDPQEKPSLDKLLTACGASAELKAGNMVADYSRLKKSKSAAAQVWSVGASQRGLVEQLFAVVQEAGIRDVRLQPAAPRFFGRYRIGPAGTGAGARSFTSSGVIRPGWPCW